MMPSWSEEGRGAGVSCCGLVGRCGLSCVSGWQAYRASLSAGVYALCMEEELVAIWQLALQQPWPCSVGGWWLVTTNRHAAPPGGQVPSYPYKR